MLFLKAVAEVALAVQLLAGEGSQLLDGIDVVEAVPVLGEAEAPGIGRLKQRAVRLGDASYGEGIAAAMAGFTLPEPMGKAKKGRSS